MRVRLNLQIEGIVLSFCSFHSFSRDRCQKNIPITN